MNRKDSFQNADGTARPASTYEFNYGAGAVDGGFTDRANCDDADFDPLEDHAYAAWRRRFEEWRAGLSGKKSESESP